MRPEVGMWTFLRRLAQYENGATRKELPLKADRPEERARQRARLSGYAIFSDRKWQITAAGREALSGRSTSVPDGTLRASADC